MADFKISDLDELDIPAAADLVEIETAGGLPYKVPVSNLPYGFTTTQKENKLINGGNGKPFSPQDGLYENKLVMITQNNNDLELFNGDIGIVRADENGVLKVWFEGKDKQLRKIEPSFISEMETVYAMTIHKSQGSEYETVLTLLPDNKDNQLLTRELLYTAVTRASKKVVIQAEEDIIWKTAAAKVKRISGIIDRITEISIP